MNGSKVLSGKVAIITGASSGIGFATAVAFAREGAKVVVADINEEGGNEVIVQCRKENPMSQYLFVKTDVTGREAVRILTKKAIEKFGVIDILVNCAGGFSRIIDCVDITEEEWDKVINLNLKSVFLCCQAVIPTMVEQKQGRIINVSSIAGRSPNAVSGAHYVAAKAGILGFTRHLARELGRYSITVNAIAPGTTESPRVAKVRTPEDREKLAAITPLGRLGKPEDHAEAIVFLASDKASYITGATLDVNGGRLMI
jgi:NAD(P)-dependent dehydrogenase (short-subunit alcohol dehydrogenase family)